MKVLILGSGQLGQMLGQVSIQLGHECLLINTRTDEVTPVGAHVALPWSIAQAVEWADVVTWEHEGISDEHVALCEHKLLTHPNQIKPFTNRQQEKGIFDRLDLRTSPWQAYQNQAELRDILEQWQGKAVIKSAEGGYDGKGQWRWNPEQTDLEQLVEEAGRQPGIVEQMIPFAFEVSLVGCRTQDQTYYCYPLVENIHRDGILSHTLVGLRQLPVALQTTAESYFQRITEDLNYIGTFAIEFFVVEEDGEYHLLINEVAPRVHNSGHWTLDGSNCSQFSLHMRALTRMPIPALQHQPSLMINAIGVAEIPEALWQQPSVSPFWYGKEPRIGRKVGHVNIQLAAHRPAQEQVQQWLQAYQDALQVLS